MRCDDLTREIASPTGALSPAEMAGHLAECPACARWSRQAARFDQIWEATRPAPPTSVMLDTLWAGASVALDASPTLRLERVSAARRRDWIKPALFFAQAAAILLAVGFYLNHKNVVNPIQTAQIDPIRADEIPLFDLVSNDGETAVVSIPDEPAKDAPQVKWLKAGWSEHSNSIPAVTSFDVINAVETMVVTKL